MKEDSTTLGPRWVRLMCVHKHTAAPKMSVQTGRRRKERKHAVPLASESQTAFVLEDCFSE